MNREAELRELDTAERHGGLLVVFGRRRVGKTRLLRRWQESGGRHGLYSQAIEAQRDLQIQQVFADLRPQLATQLVPRTWPELFEILDLQARPWALCSDEFPYLTAVDPSLPSQLQKWLDHSLPDGCLLIVAGSSTRMMNDLFLHRSAPLYGRAHKLLHVLPMDYPAFCNACNLRPGDPDSFDVRNVMTLADVAAEATARHRFRAALVATFAALALALSMAGVFGVLAYTVEQRVRDFGVRRALGATTGDVLRLVAGSAARLVATGMVLGLALALALSRLLGTLLFGVQPLDLPTFAGVAVVLALTASVATAEPAWRAARVDPAEALRAE